ncbi:MAG: phosphatase PAP2 family protein [Candidatus Algichlamydia australiensis]|nr:phosphatase PAP2 family protein [Chlamydiales bacterium]
MNLRKSLFLFSLLFLGTILIDLPLSEWIDQNSTKILRSSCRSISFLISPLLHLVLWPLLLFTLWKIKSVRNSLLLINFNILATNTLVTFLKYIIGRPRPKLFCSEGIYFPSFFCLDSNFQSFPSRHAATIATLFGFFAMRYPKQVPYLIGTLFFTTMVRVGLNSHFLSDVVAGNILGFSVAVVAHWLYTQFFLEKIHET